MNLTLRPFLDRLTAPLLRGADKQYILENLAILLSSGTDISSALSAIEQSIRSRPLQRVIAVMRNDIENGNSISDAMRGSRIVPDHILALITIGEKAGRLSENLNIVVSQEQKERLFKSKVRSAMMYPVLVLTVTFVVGIGIAWFILPRLTFVFNQLQLDLPLVTRVLVRFGTLLAKHGFLIVSATTAALASLVYIVFLRPKTRFIGQKLLFHIPGIKTLIQQVELARFGYIFGTLLQAGLPIVDALGSLEHTTDLLMYQRLYAHLHDRVEEGNSLQTSLGLWPGSRRLIPLPIQQMFAAAEQSGKLPSVALSIGNIFEAKTDVTTKNIGTLIEPILLVIVWLGVVAVALAVILPIYQLIGNLNAESGTASQRQTSGKSKTTLPKTKNTSSPGTTVTIGPVKGGKLNVRASPSPTAPVIDRAASGAVFPALRKQNGWYEISLSPSRTGWINGAYVNPP